MNNYVIKAYLDMSAQNSFISNKPVQKHYHFKNP